MIAEQAQFAKAANIGLGLDASIGKLLGRLGVGIEGRASGEKVNRETGEVQAKRQQAFDEAFNAISDQEAREAWSLHQQSRSAEQARHGHSIATGERESTTAGAARESQKQGGLRELASTLKSLSTKISQAEGSSVTLNQDQTAALVHYISKQSGRPESQVATQIGEAVKFNLMDRSGIGGKTVSQWAQEWYDHNRPTGEGSPEQGSSLKESIPNCMQEQKITIAHRQDEVGSSIQNQQDAILAEMERGKGLTVLQGEGVKQHVENARQEIGATIDSRKGEIADKKGAIDQSGQDMKNRVQDFQKEGVSLGNTVMEGIKDLNPWRDSSGSRLSEGRDKLFDSTPPHPNFYWEERLQKLDGMRKEKEH